MLAELQRADVGGNRPPVARADLVRVVGHRAEAVGHDVDEMTDGDVSQPLVVERRRPPVAAADDHSVADAGAAVTGRTENVVALPAAGQQLLVHRKREDTGVGLVDLARLEQRVVVQLAAGDRPGHGCTRRARVAEERRLAERDVLRLVVHVLPAADPQPIRITTINAEHAETQSATIRRSRAASRTASAGG